MFKKIKRKAFRRYVFLKAILQEEAADNKKLASLLLSKKELSKTHKALIKSQLKENIKMLSFVFLACLPGASITITLLIKTTKKMGIDMTPKKTF